MRLIRSLWLRRAVAAVLAVGVAVPMVPTADAADERLASFRGMLDDADAFQTALDAARGADAPLAAFALAYAEASEDSLTAAAVARLLTADTMSGVLPPAPDRAVAGPETAPTTSSWPAVALARRALSTPDGTASAPCRAASRGADWAPRCARPRGP